MLLQIGFNKETKKKVNNKIIQKNQFLIRSYISMPYTPEYKNGLELGVCVSMPCISEERELSVLKGFDHV